MSLFSVGHCIQTFSSVYENRLHQYRIVAPSCNPIVILLSVFPQIANCQASQRQRQLLWRVESAENPIQQVAMKEPERVSNLNDQCTSKIVAFVACATPDSNLQINQRGKCRTWRSNPTFMPAAFFTARSIFAQRVEFASCLHGTLRPVLTHVVHYN